ncbi:uncharacterized protein JCM15063_003979 [Sporobolomyces koalae]|uniref:uncharacterized protein n=1 Tax=Sporobolomyces koalae TaxID=500713 RepID=UPI0031729AF8
MSPHEHQRQHPLASLSAAANAVAGPLSQSQPRSTTSPAPGPSPHAYGFGPGPSNSQIVQQYYNRGSDGLVESPESGASPHQPPGNGSITHTGSSANTGKQHKKRRLSNGGSGSKDEEKDKDTSGKKRQIVSCTECKRRKIKCSRDHPCLACCKRGEPEACRWDYTAEPPKEDTQPFAISSDLLLLADRVQALEKWARSLPEPLSSTAPEAQVFKPTIYGNKTKKAKAKAGAEALAEVHPHDDPRSSRAGTLTREGTESPQRGMSVEADERKNMPFGDTEDAVVKLESVAFDQRLPGSRYRPVDSLPFFDNIPRYAPSAPSEASAQLQTTTLPESDTYASELTREKTSILAYPISFEGPFSGPSLGLPLVSSLAELKEARRTEFERIYAMLPDKDLSDRLVGRYFSEVDWLQKIIHEPIFEAELDRFWEMREGGQGDEVDPMWIACYCMVLALAVDGLRCETPVDAPTFEERKMYRPTWWYGCALRLLQLGDAAGRPQIRYIQVTLLIGQWLAFSTTGGNASRCLSLLGMAIRTAQILGLHQMSNDPAQMPPPDPAWPPHANSVKREWALRLFGFLMFLDQMSATTRFRSYLLDPLQCTTPPVSNLNYEDLSSTEWKVKPRPRSVYTHASFEWARWKVAQVAREAFARLVLQPSRFTYDVVIELDGKFRQALEDLLMALPIEEAKTRPQQWKRLVCLEGVHSRLVRMHRPFLLKKEYSRRKCLESAEIVVRHHLQIQKWTSNIWFVYAHSLAAATALFADLFDAIDHDYSERQIETKMEILVLAFEIFTKHDEITSPHLRQIVQTGSKILSGLFMAAEKRRVTRAASALVANSSNGSKNNSSHESFAQVLRRLTLELDIARAVRASPAPPSSQALPSTSIATTYSSQPTQPYQPDPSYPLPLSTDQPLPTENTFSFNLMTPLPGSGTAALPGMVGNEALSSSDFWKDGLGLGFGMGMGAAGGPTDPNVRVPVVGQELEGGLPAAGQARGGVISGFGGDMDMNASVFDFWDLGGSGGTLPPSIVPGGSTDYLVQGGAGYDWNSMAPVAAGDNRRAAEAMADQLMRSAW